MIGRRGPERDRVGFEGSGEDRPPEQDASESATDLPFPDSLCHQCAAPPRYIRTERSTFLFCPIFKRYPPQPVLACQEFVRREGTGPREEPGAGQGI